MSEQLSNVQTLCAPVVRTRQINSNTVATGTTKGQVLIGLGQPLMVPTAFARTLTCLVTSDQIITVFLRRYGASRAVVIDDAGTVLAANTPIAIVLNGETSGSGAGIGLGQEAEVRITNASGATATFSCELIAR